MTSPPHPPPPVRSWHQIVALLGLVWGLLEVGTWVREIVSTLASNSHSAALRVALTSLMVLGTVMTLVLPVGLLLLRRRLSSFVYVLAAIPPALCAVFFLISLVRGVEGERSAVYIFLALVLVRGAVATALVSKARHRARAP